MPVERVFPRNRRRLVVGIVHREIQYIHRVAYVIDGILDGVFVLRRSSQVLSSPG